MSKTNKKEQGTPEYRWENRQIGQGHYFIDLWACIQDALDYSKKWRNETLLIEQFRPERKPLLLIQKETICTTSTPTHSLIKTRNTPDPEKRLKANELIIQRIRSFFDAPTFVQPDLTRDAFYEILTASKLEANGHQEQRP